MLNIITYDPLTDIGNGRLPRQRVHTTYPEFRPTVKRGIHDDPYAHVPGEPPDKDLGYSDLVELFGYDEGRGLLELVLVKGTMIELPFQSKSGEHTWIMGRVSSTTVGSMEFKFRFLGELDQENWAQTRSRADMEITWRLPPATRSRHAERATGSKHDSRTARIHPTAPLLSWLTLAPTPTPGGLEVPDT